MGASEAVRSHCTPSVFSANSFSVNSQYSQSVPCDEWNDRPLDHRIYLHWPVIGAMYHAASHPHANVCTVRAPILFTQSERESHSELQRDAAACYPR